MAEAPPGSIQPSFMIVVGGDMDRSASVPTEVAGGTVVVAADSGLDVALAAGLAVHHVVGDLDSVSPSALDAARRAGAAIHRFPADKDATDFELAVDLVLRLATQASSPAPVPLLVVGAGGARQDMVVADLLAIAAEKLDTLEVTARYGEAVWLVVRPGRTRWVAVTARERVTLLPVHGPARGVCATGLRWPLVDADLAAGTTRGVSNEALGGEVSVSLTSGVLLLCCTGGRSAPVEARATAYDPSPRDPNHDNHPNPDPGADRDR